jgi:hypothetical protein
MHGQEHILTPAAHPFIGTFKGTVTFRTIFNTHVLSADYYTYPLNITVHRWVELGNFYFYFLQCFKFLF